MPPKLTNLTYKPPIDPYTSVVYRDEDILVLDKPSGLLTVPGRSDPALLDSLVMRVREDFPQAHPINRLDKCTSGIVLMALNGKAHSFIGPQFENRMTRKLYTSIVWGHLQDDEGIVDLPLARDPENIPCHRVDHDNGKPSQTQWRVVERLPSLVTRVHLMPLTGRTHQLRVHMQSIGHPILGDRFYAGGKALAASERLMLHAEELGFVHPNGQTMVFKIPCPF